MPNRLVHGERVWRSEKLLQVEPESFRAEFTNMLPLALANGVFECNPAKIRSDVYSFNRPSFTIRKIERILDEFERVKLLFRWRDANGKVWGFWTGIRSGGLLPTAEECRAKRYKTGPEPPADLLEKFVASEVLSFREFVAPWKNDPRSDGQTTHSDEPHADSDEGKSQHTDNAELNNALPVGNPRAANAQPMGSTLVGVGVGVGVGKGRGESEEQQASLSHVVETDYNWIAVEMTRNDWPTTPQTEQIARAYLKAGHKKELILRAIKGAMDRKPEAERQPGLYLAQTLKANVDLLIADAARIAARPAPTPPPDDCRACSGTGWKNRGDGKYVRCQHADEDRRPSPATQESEGERIQRIAALEAMLKAPVSAANA